MSVENVAGDCNSANAEGAESATKRFYPKTHTNYWKPRLEHRSYSRDGKTFEVAEWSVRIHFRGIRKSFDLETANREEAAAKARDIYLSLVAKGWSATVKELAPQPVALAEIDGDSATIGEFLAEVERTANLKPKTFRYYGSCLRQLAAYVQGGKSDASRFDYRKGGLGWKATTYRRYRCEPHWRTLIGWLESNGINARKKVHELRKLFGDAIVKRNGIFAGSAQLRHSTIQMTASHYTDPRQRAALPLGNLLSDGCEGKPSENSQQARQPPVQSQGCKGIRCGH